MLLVGKVIVDQWANLDQLVNRELPVNKVEKEKKVQMVCQSKDKREKRALRHYRLGQLLMVFWIMIEAQN